MLHPSSIHPDTELRDRLQGNIHVGLPGGGDSVVAVYGDWEHPTNGVQDDFIVVMLNGDVSGLGMGIDYAEGYIMISLYSKLNDDGTVKKNRVEKILRQINTPFIRVDEQGNENYENLVTENYVYRYEPQQFITPTTPNVTSGYSITNLNLRWTTNNNFNKPVTP